MENPTIYDLIDIAMFLIALYYLCKWLHHRGDIKK